MSAQVIIKEKYQIVQKVFCDLKEMIDKNGFDLLEDENLKSFILTRYEKFQYKMDTKITIAAIFETRTNDSSLIDPLVKEHLSKRLKCDVPYLVRGDCQSKEIQITEDVCDIKTISVPSDRWKALDNSLLLLSSNKYMDLMKEIDYKNAPDVVVLVINSPIDLRKDDIKSFLSKTRKQFTNANFFLVLNDAEDLDCAAVNICDVCYPNDIRKFLKESKIELEDNSFKISTSKYNGGSAKQTFLDENFEKLKNSLETDLKIETVLEKYYTDAQKIGRSMEQIKKSFDEKKAREAIDQINNNLNDYTPVVKQTIENYERNTNHAAVESLNLNSPDNTILGDVMKEFMKDKINELKHELKEKIKILMENDKNKEEHRKYVNFVNDIFFNENLNEKEVWRTVNKYLNIDVMKFKVEEVRATKEEISPTNSRWQIFVNGTKDVVAQICTKAKDAYDALVKTFKMKMDKILETVKSAIDHAINLLRNEFLPIYLEKCKLIKAIPLEEEKRMLDNLGTLINSITTIIKQKEKVDIYNADMEDNLTDRVYNILIFNVSKVDTYDNNIWHYIPNTVYNSTIFNVSSIMDQLYSKMRSFGYNKHTTDLANEFTDIFRHKYSSSELLRNFDNSCSREFCRFQELIQEKRFYDYKTEEIRHKISVRTAAMAGGATGGLLGGGIFSLFTAPIGAVAGGIIAASMNDKVEYKTRKFIKTSAMLDEVGKLKANLQSLIHKVIMEINDNIGKYLTFMSNMQDIQN